MTIRQLDKSEEEQVSGGVLPTKLFVSGKSFDSLIGKINVGGSVASVCQCVNCCSNHINMEDLVVNPLR